ncbi:MAG: hypothetical protein ACO1OX_07800 [Novosphingobium sp.]
MANRYFAGTSLSSLRRTSTAVVEVTTAGTFDSDFVSKSIRILNNLTDYIQTGEFSATTPTWFSFEFFTPAVQPASSSSAVICTMRNGMQNVFRIARAATSNSFLMQPQYWNGIAWVNTGNTFTLTASTLYRFNIKWTPGSGFDWYLGSALVSSGSGWTGSPPVTVTNMTLHGISDYGITASAGYCYYSQILIADFDTRDSRLKSVGLNGDSASNTGAASGVYSDVNEAVLDESTAISITTSGNKAGQTHEAITVPPGYVIGAVVVNARGRATGTITDGKLGIRTPATGNTSSTGRSYNGGYEPRSFIVDNNPDTGTRFTESEFNATEIYLEAV